MRFHIDGETTTLSTTDFLTMRGLLVWVNDKLDPYMLPEDGGDFRKTLVRMLTVPRHGTICAIQAKLNPYRADENESSVETLARVFTFCRRTVNDLCSSQRREALAQKVIAEQREQLAYLRDVWGWAQEAYNVVKKETPSDNQ